MPDDDRLRPQDRARWAPWWVYLVAILGIGYVRRPIVSPSSMNEVADVALSLATAAVVFVVVTIAYRMFKRS